MDDAQIRRRLAEGAAAAFTGDSAGLMEAERWLASLTANEQLRVDGLARAWRWETPALGKAQKWTGEVLNRESVAVLVLASMHPDGRVRERAVAKLSACEGGLADRALAVRVTDHVPVIREAATCSVLERDSLASAMWIMPVLEVVAERVRAGGVRALYLRQLLDHHGEALVWSSLRDSKERVLRRAAFRHSVARGLLDVEGAVAALPGERDQVVRGILSRVIADEASPAVISNVLLTSGTAEGRALGLVRLSATQIDPQLLQALLVDSSVLVRVWARTRWAELGHDAQATYWEAAHNRNLPSRIRARAYGGVLEAGGTIDRAEALDLLRSG